MSLNELFTYLLNDEAFCTCCHLCYSVSDVKLFVHRLDSTQLTQLAHGLPLVPLQSIKLSVNSKASPILEMSVGFRS